MSRRCVNPAPTLEDKAVIVASQVLDAAVQNLPAGERRLKYDDLFFRGDSRSKLFWVQHQAAAGELSNVFVRLDM